MSMWANVSGPKNQGGVGLQPCHGFEGRESKDGWTVTAISTCCSNTASIFLLVLMLVSATSGTIWAVTEVASVASNSVQELKVKVREVPERAWESLGGGWLSRVYG